MVDDAGKIPIRKLCNVRKICTRFIIKAKSFRTTSWRCRHARIKASKGISASAQNWTFSIAVATELEKFNAYILELINALKFYV